MNGKQRLRLPSGEINEHRIVRENVSMNVEKNVFVCRLETLTNLDLYMKRVPMNAEGCRLEI